MYTASQRTLPLNSPMDLAFVTKILGNAVVRFFRPGYPGGCPRSFGAIFHARKGAGSVLRLDSSRGRFSLSLSLSLSLSTIRRENGNGRRRNVGAPAGTPLR